MEEKTEYLLVQGNFRTFTKQIEEAEKEGYFLYGNMTSTFAQDELWHSQLMSKLTKLNERK